MLEAQLYSDNAFVTLTYRDASLPTLSSGLPTLSPPHLRNFLKRFRKSLEPNRIRFFAAGEYGDETWRPHYHLALFGYPTCVRGRTLRQPSTKGRALWEKCCASCELVGKTWGLGDVDLGILETSSAQYVCGYVTKKMTMRQDTRLLGREPEFARMSNRPGIGHDFLHEVASTYLQFNLENSQSDVPVTLRHGKRLLPLGRYMRKKLRGLIGHDEKAPQEILDQSSMELSRLRQAAAKAKVSTREIYEAENKTKLASFESKQRIFKTKRSL